MIKKILFAFVTIVFMSSCASSPEIGDDGKQSHPDNIDSDITFEGTSSANEDPFFSEPIEGGGETETAEAPVQEPEVEIPEPTPEPAEAMEPSFAEQPAPQEEYEDSTPEEPMVQAQEPVQRKKPASVNAPDAMRAPGSDCSLRSSPGSEGKRLGVAKKGRKIWTENHDGGWFKVYRKKGHAFVSKSCF